MPLCLDQQDQIHTDACPTAALAAIPNQTASCDNLTRPQSFPIFPSYHTIFTGPVGFSGLSPLVMEDDDLPPGQENVLVLGQLDFTAELDCNANGTPDACDIDACLPESPECADCNFNGIPDECDIASGKSLDGDGNGVPDECDCGTCRWDTPLSGPNGQVGAEDLAFLLGNWGPIPPDPDPAVLCLDIEPDGVIGAFDLANLLGNWGPCP